MNINLKNHIVIISDASLCRQTKIAAAGFSITSNSGVLTGSKSLGVLENSYIAEFAAMYHALKFAQHNNHLTTGATIELKTDNIHVLQCISGECHASDSIKKYLELILKIISQHRLKIKCKHVKGHVKQNQASEEEKEQNYCDHLARAHRVAIQVFKAEYPRQNKKSYRYAF